jgi:hypothetical protein
MDSTAFDLTLAIDGWLIQFQQKRRGTTSRLRPDDLDELRSHLLDQTDDLMAAGKTAEQAFQLAISQLGEPEYLAKEYRKVHYWYAYRQKAIAFSHATVTSRRIAAFSMIFVAITFGSIFGQKQSDKRRIAGSTHQHKGEMETVQHLPKVDTTQNKQENDNRYPRE